MSPVSSHDVHVCTCVSSVWSRDLSLSNLLCFGGCIIHSSPNVVFKKTLFYSSQVIKIKTVF